MKSIEKSFFGFTGAGEPVYRYRMENRNGVCVSVISYACAIQSILVPDKDGALRDIVLGYDTVEAYEKGAVFFGAMIGRYANRIAGAAFELNGKIFRLPANDGRNHLHGTYANRVFQAETEGDTLIFRGTSPDGEEGYPGNLTFTVSYRLTENDELVIHYSAETDRDTVVNFTNHSYFNLDGQNGSDVLDHVLRLNSSSFTECTEETIPTGRILCVDGTPMDFRKGKRIGDEISSDYVQIRYGSGYDHNFILDAGTGLKEAAVLYSRESGITLRCLTDQPGIQLYTGNFLRNEQGKNSTVYPIHGGVCLETQHYPCSPNFPEFPSTVLRPEERYSQSTVYCFRHD